MEPPALLPGIMTAAIVAAGFLAWRIGNETRDGALLDVQTFERPSWTR